MTPAPDRHQPAAARQLALEFPLRPAKGRADFLVTAANREAISLIDAWPHWPGGVAAIFGPPACGKSHLVAVWQAASGGGVVDGADSALTRESPDRLVDKHRHLAVDNASALGARDAEWLLHLFNLVREAGGTLLLAAELAPANWQVGLADLDSRLRTGAAVAIDPPDDDLVRGLLLKHFSDRQLTPEMDVVTFLLARAERSFDGIRRLVEDIDRAAAEKKRPVTVPLVRDVLDRRAERD